MLLNYNKFQRDVLAFQKFILTLLIINLVNGYGLGSLTDSPCGGMLDARNAVISSPMYPNTYPSNRNCLWDIVARRQQIIILNFTLFDLEEGINKQCVFDKVVIYSRAVDGAITNHGVSCGSQLPPVIISHGNMLRIKFSSDGTVEKQGFSAFTQISDLDECSINNGGCEHKCNITAGFLKCSCHNGYSLHENGRNCTIELEYEITDSLGRISYPDINGWRGEYIWRFTTTPGHRIQLRFSEFHLEYNENCRNTYVEIYDGYSDNAPRLGTFCGTEVPFPVTSSGHEMYMVIKSDSSNRRNKIAASHLIVCGGKINALEHMKSLFSHVDRYSKDYPNEINCEWTIQSWIPRTRIKLIFTKFDLETSTDCANDYVEIFDGPNDSSPKRGRYCGNSVSSIITSTTGSLFVRFHTDGSVTGKGFAVMYKAESTSLGFLRKSNSFCPFCGTIAGEGIVT